jgi:hypothetical protein
MPSNPTTGGVSRQERHDAEFLRPRSAAHTDMDTGERHWQPVTPEDKHEGTASGFLTNKTKKCWKKRRD